MKLDGSAERFRTSCGIAESCESLFRQSLPQHGLHNSNLGALSAVDVGGEVEQHCILTRARRVVQVLYHNQRAAMMLNHSRQKQSIELRALCFSESVHLLWRKHAG